MFKHRDATSHGIDISASRMDDIDRAVISFALAYKGKKVAVDIGCGSGRVSIILALMGFDVWLYDIQEMKEYFMRVGEALNISDRLHFQKVDISKVGELTLPHDIVIVLSQRTLHHVPYVHAQDALQEVVDNMISGGRLFLSVSGRESKLAIGYECANSPVTERFCEVGEVGKTTYSINGKVCLYTQTEVVEMVEGVGLLVEEVSTSAFGNIKLIGSKT
jgi:SAM-dependent methyltransferase